MKRVLSMVLGCFAIAGAMARAEDIDLEKSPPGCDRYLKVGAPVIARFITKNSRRAALRVHDALLRLPAKTKIEVIFANLDKAHLVGIEALRKSMAEDPEAFEITLYRQNYGGHDWNYGEPDGSLEVLGLRGRPAAFERFVGLMEKYDQVILVTPDAVLTDDELFEGFDDPEVYLFDRLLREMLETDLVAMLSRMREPYALLYEDYDTHVLSFQAQRVDEAAVWTFSEEGRAAGGLNTQWAHFPTEASTDGHKTAGSAYVEFEKLSKVAVLKLLAHNPSFTLTKARKREAR